MKKQNVRTLSLIVCTFTYLLIGAAIFDSIESEEEQKQKEALEKLEEQLKNKYNISDQDLVLMDEMIHLWQPFKAGMPWKFAGSFYYATTVLTTIGYGHSTPKTDAGKFFTMVYAMIGIPLGLIMFNSIGERLNNFSSMAINKVRRVIKAKQPETTEIDLILVALTLSFIVVFTGAATFSHYEGWTYFNSIYYCFVTLTTIGFGDLVALQQDNALESKPEYVTFALFFIMFGLAIIAASLNLMVLKFMMLNTEDEKRDEQQAIKAAAHTVRLDGDVILQQTDMTNSQVEGNDSTDDVQTVCSCNGCCPFRQLMYSPPPRGAMTDILAPDPNLRRQHSVSAIEDHFQNPPPQTFCDRSVELSSKTEFVYDLRQSPMCSALRLPSSPRAGPSRTSGTDCQAPKRLYSDGSRERSSREGNPSEDRISSVLMEDADAIVVIDVESEPNIISKIWRTLRRPSYAADPSPPPGDKRNSSFILDEMDTIKVIPKELNSNHYKRVSL